MKNLKYIFLSAFLIAFSLSGFTQALCPGALLSDDYSNPSNWSYFGTQTGGGTLGVTGGQMTWNNYQSRQNYRMVQNVGAAIPNSRLWRVEWEFMETGRQNTIGGLIMSLTSTTQHPRWATPGGNVETNQNTIEVMVGNALAGGNPHYFFISNKFGTHRDPLTPQLSYQLGKYYYMRLERTSPANGILSVFYDAARTQHIPNSPLCFTMQSEIDSLQYIQQGVWTSSSAGRYITATVDNLCIYDNVIGNELCDTLNCELWPKIDWNYTTTCTVTFKDVSRFGPGTTPLGNFPIDFGDGNTGTIPVGGTVTHTYPNSGTYQVCMRIFGHSSNPMYDCCTEEICTFITVDCEPK